MRNKLILFLMLALFGSATFLRADEVTIGDPSVTVDNSYLPMNSLYNYSFTEQIYTAAELGFTSGTINSFTMWMKGSVPARTFEIYMVETTKDEFSGTTDWVPMAAENKVYEGTVATSADYAPYVFTLTTPFDYNGGNLLIAFNNITGSWNSGLNGNVFGDASGDPQRSLYVRQDGAAYNIAAPGTATGITGLRNVIKINYTSGTLPPPPPPTPTGELTITPNPLVMGERPTVTSLGDDAWMEPYTVRIANGSTPTHIEAVVTNASTLEPFSITPSPYVADLEADEAIEITIEINRTLPDGDYLEELVVSYSEGGKSMIQVPLSAKFYSPVQGDVVEDPLPCDPTSAPALNPTGMYHNYNLKDMAADEAFPDVVYTFTLAEDGIFEANMDKNGYIYVFNYEDPATFHPTAATEPVVYIKNGTINKMLPQGDYYLIIAAEELNTATINLNATLITAAPDPTQLVNIAPANSANEVTVPVTLEWDNAADATQYQVYFGTTYSPALVVDWTMIEDIHGTYTIDALDNNTQYFWQIKNKNSLGEITGELWGFTTPLQPPTNVRATETEIFTDGSTLIKWNGFTVGGYTGSLTVADGTTTSSYIPVYGLWVDDYTRSEMIYPESMLTEMIGGEITSLQFYLSSPATAPWAPAVFNVYMKEVSSTTLSDAYIGSSDATIVYTGALDGTGSIMTINLTTPYTYNGGNLLLGIEEPVEGTYKSASFYGIESTGSSASGYSSSSLTAVTFNQRNFLPKTTFVCGGGAKGMTANRSFKGYNVYYSGIKANTELITERQYLLENLPYAMPGGHEIHVTNVFDEGESPYDGGTTIVYVSGYGYLEGNVTELNSGDPIANVTINFSGKDEFDNDVQYTATTDASGHYEVKVKDGVYNRGVASLDGMENAYGNPLPATVNDMTYTTVDFVMHEVYTPIYKVYAQELDPTTAKVTWSRYNFVPGVPGSSMGDEFFENFDNSAMPAGWSTIDADGDGYNWVLGSAVMSTGYGHNGSTDMIMSQSYAGGVVLYPDNYLVTPRVNIGTTSTFSFWACAQDASYPSEHYGVAVSTTGTNASDFTMIEEWTMTAKNDGTAKGPRGTNVQGTWYQKTIDMSAYAGQQVYIALRHFNCHDMFYLDVDEITLSNATKAEAPRALDHYTVVRKALLKETPIVLPDDSVYLATLTDTLYADFDWDNMPAGLYQYGVRTVYPGGDPMKGNRAGDELTVHDGTSTNSYVPIYGLYTDAYLRCQYVMTEDLLVDMVGGTINGMTFYLSTPASASWGAANFQVYMKPFTSAGISGFEDPSTATVVYNGPLDGTQPTLTVTFSTPYPYTGGNLLIGFDNTNIGTYKSASFYGESVSGACVQGYSYSALGSISPTQRNFVPKTTFLYDASAGGAADDPTTAFTWSNILPKDMDATLTVNAVTTTGTVEGAQVKLENVNAETFEENYVFEDVLDENGEVTFTDFRKGQYKVSVMLDGFVSEYNETIVDFWEDVDTITAHFVEDFVAVPTLTVSGTGYARWTSLIPDTDVAERYIVKLNEIFQGETTNNYMQLDVTGLEAGHDYAAAVAVIYTTGMSAWTTTTFTYLGCEAVTTDVDTLWIEWDEDQHMDVVLNWNEGSVTPPTPPTPPSGDVTVKLTAGDIWGDGTGYQMLLDDTHSLYGSVIPTSGALSTSCSGNEGIYSQFSHKIPTNADGNCSTSNIVYMNTVTLTIPSGTYDWCITNPTPGDRIWIAAANGNVGGRYDDYVFEAGNTYEFTISMYGTNDGVDVTITPGAKLDQPAMAIPNDDCKNINDVVKIEKVTGNFSAAGQGFGQATTDNRDGNWYYYDNGVNEDGIGTGGGNFWWGVMFPAGSYDGNKITKVAAYDYMPMTGTVTIYNDGATAPVTSVGSMNVTFTGTEDFVEFVFDSPVTVDPSKNVWVVFYNGSGATYPAGVCTNTGDANGRWVSLDGSSWEDLASYSLNYTFMVRAYIESAGGGGSVAGSSITPNKFNIFMDGEIVGATADNTFTVTAEDFLEHCYEVVWVDGDYNFSCGQVLCFAVPITDVNSYDVVNRIYPNPTNGDLHIEASDITRISVVNALGQVVYDAKMTANEAVLNMGRFNAGVYMVNVVTKNGTSVKRVVVTK